jgi:hypothetical protein
LKILILHPGRVPPTPEKISCFTDVWTYYLSRELRRHVSADLLQIPGDITGDALHKWFLDLDVTGYRAVIALGLRYFSTIPKHVAQDLKNKIGTQGFLCQIHDGSRLDNDPVDITFTIKDETPRYPLESDANRYVRHHASNVYVGWAADPTLNSPAQDASVLRILVDHTNYGDNPVDHTKDILHDIQGFIRSEIWKNKWDQVKVRRFDSGCVVDVDFDRIDEIQRYDRKAMPFSDICGEHSAAHVFCVTHPESVGLVVLETAMAGALSLVPQRFVPADRLATVRHIEYERTIPWKQVLRTINPEESRRMALVNSWERVAKRIRAELWIRSRIRCIYD